MKTSTRCSSQFLLLGRSLLWETTAATTASASVMYAGYSLFDRRALETEKCSTVVRNVPASLNPANGFELGIVREISLRKDTRFAGFIGRLSVNKMSPKYRSDIAGPLFLSLSTALCLVIRGRGFRPARTLAFYDASRTSNSILTHDEYQFLAELLGYRRRP